MKGDLSGHSSLIARNHDELEILKHKGDRNYYEFTLTKGQKKPVGTVSLELKKADCQEEQVHPGGLLRRQEYEKKDRNLNEPLQFYSGKDPALFEIVVNSVGAQETRSAGICPRPRVRRRRLLLVNNSDLWGERTRLGLYWNGEGKAQVLARIPLLFGQTEGRNESSLDRLAGSDGRHERQPRIAVRRRAWLDRREDAVVIPRRGRIAGVNAVVQRGVGHDVVHEERVLALVMQLDQGKDVHLVISSLAMGEPLASNP
jgi:hypothetical protein